jgi:hypothetical protein
MPLIKLIRGARYSFSDTLVQKGEVIEVNARTRNRLVRGGYFEDAASHERPSFIPMSEEDDDADTVRGGQDINENVDPSIFGAQPDEPTTGPHGGRGKGQVHRRGGSETVNDRAAEAKGKQDSSEEAATEEAGV